MTTNLVRVRFAPSPTGPLHIGGLRTALFNYLYAKKYNGSFILRIEDTDQARFVPGAEDYILEALHWCGLDPDEGVGAGGDYGPYRQSERKDFYWKYAKKLIFSDDAYYAFDTPEELDQLRKEYEQRKETFVYDQHTRSKLRNSLSLDCAEVDKLIKEGYPYVVRFKFQEDQELVMQDVIRGEIVVKTSSLDDKILFKSDGMPTYHLANVVDDHLMKITDVIRGEEWLPSLPLHVSLYRAFRWEENMPHFAHLPLILKPDGKGKLSKRDGDKGGFPVFPLNWQDPKSGEISSGYRESGYFPEACINILALLGWNPGTEKEIFTLDELVQEFDLSKVGKSGSKFDPEKAKWFNHQYLQLKSDEEISYEFNNILLEKNIHAEKEKLEKIVGLVKERAGFIHELWDHSDFFFEAPLEYHEQTVKKRWKENSAELMKTLSGIINDCSPFTTENLEHKVKSWIEENEQNMGAVMNAWRLCMVGAPKGPGLFDIAVILGKEEVLKRINTGIEKLG
jgi:glutamyl-tRNA synthetase